MHAKPQAIKTVSIPWTILTVVYVILITMSETDGSCQKVSEKVIPNCLEYSSKTSNNLICSKCISGYALSSNACTTTGSIDNCKTLN